MAYRLAPSETESKEIDPMSAIAPQIYARLRDAIIRNAFPPGERLSEAEIARSYGVSRQPVREAFIKLASEDLLANPAATWHQRDQDRLFCGARRALSARSHRSRYRKDPGATPRSCADPGIA